MATKTEIVQALFDGFGDVDPERLADFFTDDATIQPVMKEPYEGRAGIVRMFGLWKSGFTKVDTPVRHLISSGDVAFIEWLDKSEFNGEPHIVPCVGVFEFAGDKIAAWRLYYDSAIEGSTEISGLNPPLSRSSSAH
jgi:limonene-1,2-epoxide hydrolase